MKCIVITEFSPGKFEENVNRFYGSGKVIKARSFQTTATPDGDFAYSLFIEYEESEAKP